jgi:hypothetical protein
MTVPNDVFGLSEIIEGFTFRNKGGVKILKKWREEAVIMQVDVEVVSVAKTQYINYRSLPAFGFYGYATLVMRDFCLPQIPIVQPRQTIYYAVNEFAQSAWMEFHQMIRIQENFKGVESLVCTNTGLLGGACVPVACKPLPQPSFVEFPLREIFLKMDDGTQFNLELSYWKINPVLDNCGNLISPKSNQNDGDKDDGLPPFGSAPQQAGNPNNPFAGLPPVSPFDREGVISDDRINDLDKPNPDNAPEPDTSGLRYDITIYTRDYLNGCAGSVFEAFYPVAEGLLEPPNFVVEEVNNFVACGVPYKTIRVLLDGVVLGGTTSISSSLAVGIVPYDVSVGVGEGFYYGFREV